MSYRTMNTINNKSDSTRSSNTTNEQTNTQDKSSNIFECEIDYKDVKLLQRFTSERGKIIPSRINNQPVKRQREIAKAIKRARILALMPFIND